MGAASDMKVEKAATTRDPRITRLRRIGGGEGYATYSGLFEGKPAFIVGLRDHG